MLPFLVSVTLTGLVRISKVRYRWKDLSLKLLLFINLYPASRGLSIFLDMSEGLKGALHHDTKLEQYLSLERIEFRNTKTKSQVLRNQLFFIVTTQKDFGKQFISRET